MFRAACFALLLTTPLALAQSTTGAESTPDSRDKVYYPGDTESLKPLGRKLAANIWMDQKQIWTSPFHMHEKQAFWWVSFGAVTAALIATDRSTSKTFENSSGQVRWGNRLSNIGSGYTVVPVVAGFYGLGVVVDNAKARETGVLGAEALVDSLIVGEVLKPIAGRERPDGGVHRGNFFSGGSSFPSGHALASWTLASVVAHEYSDTVVVPIVAYGLAGVVSAARFAAQKHYASDIVAGGAMGWFIGRYVYKTHQDHGIHHHAWLEPRIVPQVQPGTNTYTVTLAFSGTAGQ